jgi:hypothetical protein
MFLQPAFEQRLDEIAVALGEPTMLDQNESKWDVLAGAPERTSLSELGCIYQPRLQGQYTEEQVAVGVHRRLQKTNPICKKWQSM